MDYNLCSGRQLGYHMYMCVFNRLVAQFCRHPHLCIPQTPTFC